MKKIFLLFGNILLFVLASSSQEYLPIPDSNATWIVTDNSGLSSISWEYGLNILVDDTIIESKVYNKIFLKDLAKNDEYVGAFRNDTNGRIFYVPNVSISSQEYLWYDFTKNVSDTIKDVALNIFDSFCGTFDLIVDSVNYVNSGPYNLKCLFLSPISPYPPYYNGDPIIWVEKIGSLSGGIFNNYLCGFLLINLSCMSTNDTTFYSSTFFDCYFIDLEIALCYEPGSCEFPVRINRKISENAQIIVYPNPVKDYIMIKNIPLFDEIDLNIFNIFGQRIFSSKFSSTENNYITLMCDLTPGMYFISLISQYDKLLIQKIIVK